MRCRVLQGFRVDWNKGDVVDVPDSLAKIWCARGYLEPAVNEPETVDKPTVQDTLTDKSVASPRRRRRKVVRK